jgi:hypothetical protein
MAEVLLPNFVSMMKVKFTAQNCDADRNPVSRYNILDMREYKAQFPDGATNSFTANISPERS